MRYREVAECCVHSSEIRMIPLLGRTETMHCRVLNSVCQLVQNDLCVCWTQEVPYVVGSRAMYVLGVQRIRCKANIWLTWTESAERCVSGSRWGVCGDNGAG